jgi:competence protein ComEC
MLSVCNAGTAPLQTTTQPPTTTTTQPPTITTTPPPTTTTTLPPTTTTTPPPTTTTTPPPTPPVPELKVHFIDVGQGDAILIDLGETEILIDGGGKSPGVVSYLNDYVDGAIEVMVATHPHADHIGGLIAVLGAFSVQEIWHNGDTSTSQTYSQFMAAVQAEGAEVQTGRRGDEISVGGLIFTVLNPITLGSDINNNSLVLSLSYGEVDFLFMGDAENGAEGAMLIAADMPVPDVEILKVGHHGSRTSSSQAFLALAKPEVAIYMAGEGNSYGHPHEETINALMQIGADIYGTGVYGTIIITTDGDLGIILIDVNTPRHHRLHLRLHLPLLRRCRQAEQATCK